MNEEREKWVTANNLAVAPILNDLAAMGFRVKTLSDLVTARMEYATAIPLLVDWLDRVENQDVKLAIIQCLSVRAARSIAGPALIREFKSLDGWMAKWTAGNALSVVADDSVFEEVAALALDKSYGRAREMLAVALGNMRSPRAVGVLMQLLEDEEVSGHAIIALGKLKVTDARDAVLRFLDSPKAWVRNEAKKALKRIDASRP